MDTAIKDKLKQVNRRTNVLNTSGQNDAFKKVVGWHQANEYLHINNYMEAKCFMCFGKDVALATVVQICEDCLKKKGKEAILVKIKVDMYGLCFNCGKYKFDIHHLNVRVCHKCNSRIVKVIDDWKRAGGMYGSDPFYQMLKSKLGKDWQILSNPFARSCR